MSICSKLHNKMNNTSIKKQAARAEKKEAKPVVVLTPTETWTTPLSPSDLCIFAYLFCVNG